MARKKKKSNKIIIRGIVLLLVLAAVALVVNRAGMGPASCSGIFKDKKMASAPEKKEKPFYFNDYQRDQIGPAMKYGITPVESRDTDFAKIPQLEKVVACEYYDIEWLSHSVPYLTHHAKRLLDQIGKDFQDSLAARGVRKEKIVVTSLLRTKADVQRLTKVNANASANSTHCYGTTFDVAHNSFNPTGEKGEELSYRELKKVLAHVLFRLRMKDECRVLVEERQSCFHITCNS